MTYKVFANGNPLQASEINLNLMQQAIAVFTDATARDAAISVPVNGQFAYLTASEELVKYDGAAWVAGSEALPITTEGDLIVGDASGDSARFPIGADGTVLSSDGTTIEWATPGAPSANFSQLATGSLAGTSTSVTGLTSFNKFFVLVYEARSTSAGSIISVTINGVSTGYKNQHASLTMNASYSFNNLGFGEEQTRIAIGKGSSSASSKIGGGVSIDGGKSSGLKFFQHYGAANPSGSATNRMYVGAGVFTDSDPITSIQINTSAGSFDSGEYFIYGSD